MDFVGRIHYQLELLDSNSYSDGFTGRHKHKRRAAPEANALVSDGDHAENVPLD